MENPSEQYRAAAAEMTEQAGLLEGGHTDADTALGATLRVLERLTEVEPQGGTAQALHGLGERLRSAGTIGPDKLRELAGMLQGVAQNHDELQARLSGIWS